MPTRDEHRINFIVEANLTVTTFGTDFFVGWLISSLRKFFVLLVQPCAEISESTTGVAEIRNLIVPKCNGNLLVVLRLRIGLTQSAVHDSSPKWELIPYCMHLDLHYAMKA